MQRRRKDALGREQQQDTRCLLLWRTLKRVVLRWFQDKPRWGELLERLLTGSLCVPMHSECSTEISDTACALLTTTPVHGVQALLTCPRQCHCASPSRGGTLSNTREGEDSLCRLLGDHPAPSAATHHNSFRNVVGPPARPSRSPGLPLFLRNFTGFVGDAAKRASKGIKRKRF